MRLSMVKLENSKKKKKKSETSCLPQNKATKQLLESLADGRCNDLLIAWKHY